jgi:hypothetical protein
LNAICLIFRRICPVLWRKRHKKTDRTGPNFSACPTMPVAALRKRREEIAGQVHDAEKRRNRP